MPDNTEPPGTDVTSLISTDFVCSCVLLKLKRFRHIFHVNHRNFYLFLLSSSLVVVLAAKDRLFLTECGKLAANRQVDAVQVQLGQTEGWVNL